MDVGPIKGRLYGSISAWFSHWRASETRGRGREVLGVCSRASAISVIIMRVVMDGVGVGDVIRRRVELLFFYLDFFYCWNPANLPFFGRYSVLGAYGAGEMGSVRGHWGGYGEYWRVGGLVMGVWWLGGVVGGR